MKPRDHLGPFTPMHHAPPSTLVVLALLLAGPAISEAQLLGTVRGRVTEAATGLPLGGVTVRLATADGTLVASSTTGVDGRYLLEGPAPAVCFVSTANEAGYEDEGAGDATRPDGTAAVGRPVVLRADGTPAEIDFALSRPGRVEGLVLSELWRGPISIARARVDLLDSTGMLVRRASGITDIVYGISTAGVPDGLYYVRARSFNHGGELFDGVPCPFETCDLTGATPIDVRRGQVVSGIDFSLGHSWWISGRVYTPHHSGAYGARVWAYDASGNEVDQVDVDPYGFFSTDLPPGTYFVRASLPPDYEDALFGGMPCVGGRCDPTAGTPIVLDGSAQFYSADIVLGIPDPACAVSVASREVSLPSFGGRVALEVTTAPGCDWGALSGQDWLGADSVIAPTGGGTIVVSAGANTGSTERVGSLRVGGQMVRVRQARSVPSKFFAEGAANAFFDCRYALVNPSATDAATALFTFMTDAGANITHVVSVPPLTRRTLDVKDVPGLAPAEFATRVESDVPLVVDRTMSWDGSGYGSHSETGAASPSTSWYLAEGSTAWDFDLFYVLQNPGDADATITVTYLRPAPLAPVTRAYTAPARSRRTIWVDKEGPELEATDVSARIESDQPIVVERAMYLNRAGETFGAGHNSLGVTDVSPTWYLAEGATGSFFDEFLVLANPGPLAADVEATYLLTGGGTVTRHYTVSPHSRFTIWTDHEHPLLEDASFGVTLTAANGVGFVAERVMWWPGPTAATWMEAHNAPGATSPGTLWALAEGADGGPAHTATYIVVANTSAYPGQISVTAVFEDREPSVRTFDIPPLARFTVDPRVWFPDAFDRRFGALVESVGQTPALIVVERPMYQDANGIGWAAGSDAVATRIR